MRKWRRRLLVPAAIVLAGMEKAFLVDTINRLEQTPDRRSTAVVIAYDDSDGWYDHQLGPIVNQSHDAADALAGPGLCGTKNQPLGGYQDRCGSAPTSCASQ